MHLKYPVWMQRAPAILGLLICVYLLSLPVRRGLLTIYMTNLVRAALFFLYVICYT